jgi:hypothetical protein
VRRRVDLDVEEQPTGEERDRGTGGANSASTLPKMIATTSAWANSASVARNASNAIVVWRIRSAFGVAASVYILGQGHNPPIYVAMPEFLGSGIRATVVGWKRASSGHR